MDALAYYSSYLGAQCIEVIHTFQIVRLSCHSVNIFPLTGLIYKCFPRQHASRYFLANYFRLVIHSILLFYSPENCCYLIHVIGGPEVGLDPRYLLQCVEPLPLLGFQLPQTAL